MRYFIELSYNGSAYHGWQNQADYVSVQGYIEKALSNLLKQPLSIVGAGRTDAGVHAKQMFAHFDYDTPFDVNHLIFKLNSYLPKDIVIHDIFNVKDDIHARFSALSRTYIYRIALKKDAFNYNSAYFVKKPLHVDKMKAAAKILFEYKDFQCFSKSNTDVKTYYCDIMKAEWNLVDNELQFTIKADRFLRNMVRAIVGTMLNIGLEIIQVEDLHTIIQSKNRSEAGYSVPAHALYLVEVEYPNDIKV